MIIGIAGTLASGKGTVVRYLQSKGFTHYSASAELKRILAERGLPATRENMSPLANELSAEHPGGVLQVIHERARAEGARDYVLEAIHRESEAQYVRSIGGKILGVDADLHTRYERTLRRADGAKDDVSFEQFLEHAKREDEGQGNTGPNIRAVIAEADAVITNDGTLESLRAQVDAALGKLGHPMS